MRCLLQNNAPAHTAQAAESCTSSAMIRKGSWVLNAGSTCMCGVPLNRHTEPNCLNTLIAPQRLNRKNDGVYVDTRIPVYNCTSDAQLVRNTQAEEYYHGEENTKYTFGGRTKPTALVM